MTLFSFLFFLAAFLAVGLLSALKSRGTRRDYYLADHDVSPALVGLSAVATNNSGYMFIGVIGFTYVAGLASIWLMVGWIIGDFIASLFIHYKLRQRTESLDEATFGGLLSRWEGREFRIYRRVAAIVSIVFLGAYAAAQLTAGGKALQALFGWHPHSGAIIGGVMVVAYCFAGGIRASIWTDAAQSVVMMAAMGTLMVVGIAGLGGPAATFEAWQAVPNYLDWFPADLPVPGPAGMTLFVIGWLFAGFSVVGQPHIMVRFMALDSLAHLWRARAYYYSFFTVFYAMATAAGMLARLYLPELDGLDTELALPTMAQQLLPPVLVGLILAGIFAATMSTADSLVLSCSAALTHDLLPKRLESKWEIKGATVAVVAFALAIALFEVRSVFSLVILAWSVLASAFAPLLFVYSRDGRPSETQALIMMGVGVGVALIWRQAGLHETIYEGFPGIVSGIAAYYLLSALFPAGPALVPERDRKV